MAVGATWIGPVSAPEPLPLAAGDWVTEPLVPLPAADTGALSVGATWIGPIRLPVDGLPGWLPAGGVLGWLPAGGVLGWVPAGGVLGWVPDGGVLGWVPAGVVLGWVPDGAVLGWVPDGGVLGWVPDGRVPWLPGSPDCDAPGSPYCGRARPVPWLPENQKLNWALSTQTDAFADRDQLRMPSWRQRWWWP